MTKELQHTATVFLCCAILPAIAQAPPNAHPAQPVSPTPFVMTWKPDTPGCDERYINGREIKSQFTSQAAVAVALIPDSGKLAVFVYLENPQKSPNRIEVIPEGVHLFKDSSKGLLELKRSDAVKMAKSSERRVRIGQSIAAGLSAGGSQTTATGTATYSDGTTADYSVTMPNPQAQNDAINRAQANIKEAHAEGALLVAEELKRSTLDPGQDAMGRVFFPNQKGGQDLLVRIDIGNVRYEFPFHLPGKHDDVSNIGGKSAAFATPTQDRSAPATVELADRFLKRAEQGDPIAEDTVGSLYFLGKDLPQDYAQSAAWHLKAAEQGNAHSQYELGVLFQLGLGVHQSYAQAAVWYSKGADQGEVDAQYGFGVLCLSGMGVPKDNSVAYFWLNLAAAGAREEDRETYVKARDEAAAKLSPDELQSVQARAAEWFASHQPSRRE